MEKKSLDRERRFLYTHEEALRNQGHTAIAGIDEAGRGPLAGPVVAAAVVLPAGLMLPGLFDSKKVSPTERYRLEEEIKARATAWAVAQATSEEIDCINILEATKLAMGRALAALSVMPDYLLLDGLRQKLTLPEHFPGDIPLEAVVKGDAKVACISAASILAKTCRDREMEQWDVRYPSYGFAKHKGYPTAAHRQAVIAYGACPIHRQSFLGFAKGAQQRAAHQLSMFTMESDEA